MKFCFGIFHRWHCVAVLHYLDISYSSSGMPSTRATFRCDRCGNTKQTPMYGAGHLTTAQLNGGESMSILPDDKDLPRPGGWLN